MLEKFKDRKTENLILFLILLIVTLMLMNKILKDEPEEVHENKYAGSTLAKEASVNTIEGKLESILSKVEGVGEISILLTYEEDELEGAIVVADGAKDPKTKTNIISTIETATGLGKHKIQVYEMKKIEI